MEPTTPERFDKFVRSTRSARRKRRGMVPLLAFPGNALPNSLTLAGPALPQRSGTLRPLGLAGLNTFPEAEDKPAPPPPAQKHVPAPLTGSFTMSSRPTRRRKVARTPEPATYGPVAVYQPPPTQPSFVSVPSLTVVPPATPPPQRAAAPTTITVHTAPPPTPDPQLLESIRGLQEQVSALAARGPPAPPPAPAAPTGVSDADILAMLATAALAQPPAPAPAQPQQCLDGAAIMAMLQSLGASMVELHAEQGAARSAAAQDAAALRARQVATHTTLNAKAARTQETADEILKAISELSLTASTGDGPSGGAAMAAAAAGAVGQHVGGVVAEGLAELQAAQAELHAALLEALARKAAPAPAPAPPQPDAPVSEMWEEYSSGGESGHSSEGPPETDSSHLMTLDAFIAGEEQAGRVPAVYGGRAAGYLRAGDSGHFVPLDDVLSVGEVAAGEASDLSDGEVVTVPQGDISFVRSEG